MEFSVIKISYGKRMVSYGIWITMNMEINYKLNYSSCSLLIVEMGYEIIKLNYSQLSNVLCSFYCVQFHEHY